MDAVLSDNGCLPLFSAAHLLHLNVCEFRIDPGARAASAIGHDDPTEPSIAATEAISDAGIGHNFNIVLMSGDAEVGGPSEGIFGCEAGLRNENICGGMGKFHAGKMRMKRSGWSKEAGVGERSTRRSADAAKPPGGISL